MSDGWALKWVAITLVVVAAAGVLISGTASADTQEEIQMNGTGTLEDPYVITNATHLQAIRQDLDANYTLGADIDASGTEDWNGGNGFDPIGLSGHEFTGTLDGRDHVIERLTINRPDEEKVALFRENAGNIGNLHLRDIRITAGEESATLVARNEGAIRNVTTNGYLIARGDDIGGVVGFNLGSAVAVRSNMDINGTDFVGGLVGRNQGPLRASVSYANVTASDFAGGIVGANSDTVSESHSHGVVRSDNIAGGIAGENTGTITNSYAAAVVKRPWKKGGGIAGGNNGIIVETYWDVSATGQNTSNATGMAGGTGLETEQMTGEAVVENTKLNFDGTWQTTEEYPVLNPEIGNETFIPYPEPEPTPTPTPEPTPTPTPESGGLLGIPLGAVGGLGAAIVLCGSVLYVYGYIKE